MKFCKVCLLEFSEDLQKCPHDGNALIAFKEDGSLIQGMIIDGRYKIMEEIGRGGFSSIYTAYQFSMDRIVAIKVLSRALSSNKTILQRFIRESKALAKLAHPNIITVFESGSTDDALMYIVMEFLTGKPLDDFGDEQEIPLPIALEIVIQICDALSEAHSKGIIHRDLKPSNVFIEEKKGVGIVVKVLDFGIAKILSGEDDNEPKVTVTGFTFGTPQYMSPEQALGTSDVNPKSDIYSLGIIIYEILAGERPFAGKTPSEILGKQINEKPKPFGEVAPNVFVPQKLQDLVFRCLEKEPEKRFESTEEIKALLLECKNEISSGLSDISKEFEKKQKDDSKRLFVPQSIEKIGINSSVNEFDPTLDAQYFPVKPEFVIYSPQAEMRPYSNSSPQLAVGQQQTPSYPSLTTLSSSPGMRALQPRKKRGVLFFFLFLGFMFSLFGLAALIYLLPEIFPASIQNWVSQIKEHTTKATPKDISKLAALETPIKLSPDPEKNTPSFNKNEALDKKGTIAAELKPKASYLEILVKSTPKKARVYHSKTNQLLGETDFKMILEAGVEKTPLIFKLEGYEDWSLELNPAQAKEKIEVTLKKREIKQLPPDYKSPQIPATRPAKKTDNENTEL